jgi:hypothetical protein
MNRHGNLRVFIIFLNRDEPLEVGTSECQALRITGSGGGRSSLEAYGCRTL